MTEEPRKKLGRPPTLTQRQMKFAELLVFKRGQMTPTQCAFEAGYKNRSRQNAGDLRNATKFPLVATYIKELEAEAREKYGIDFHKHIEQLGKIRNKAFKDKSTLSSAVTSEVARGKAAGLYIDRRQTTNVNLELDKMSYEDLIEKMSEFVDGKKEKKVTPSEAAVEQ